MPARGESRREPRARPLHRRSDMATQAQITAAKKNIKKAIAAAKRSRSMANLPKKTRSALGKKANAVKQGRATKKR